MSLSGFLKAYEPLKGLPLEASKIDRMTKPEISKHLVLALKALQTADELIAKQGDLVMATNQELLKQCEISRGNCIKSSENTHAAVPKTSPIILKPVSNGAKINVENLSEKLRTSLKNIQVNRAHVSDKGTVILNVPSQQSHDDAVKILGDAFSDFSVEDPKIIVPKIFFNNVPDHITDENFVSSLCEKNEILSQYVSDGDGLTVVKSWSPKNWSDKDVKIRNVVLECSVRIRNHVIERCGGYVYLDLCRCRAQDFVSPLRCYHCHRFNHIASNCPDKTRPPVCGFCSGFHESKNCKNKKSKACINCRRNGVKNSNHNHNAFSSLCPTFEAQKKSILSKINFDNESTNNQSETTVTHPKNG